MSDDRISPTPKTPRCPLCQVTIWDSSGVCPRCSWKAPAGYQPPVPELRVPREVGRSRREGTHYDGSLYAGVGLLFLLVTAFFAFRAPGVLIPFAVVFVPAVIRTIRLANGDGVHEARSPWTYLVGALLASLGIALLAGIASAVASTVVCFAIGVVGSNWTAALVGMIAGGVVGLFVFSILFYQFWPRESDADKRQRSPDPEN
jgi:hypothetical protein